MSTRSRTRPRLFLTVLCVLALASPALAQPIDVLPGALLLRLEQLIGSWSASLFGAFGAWQKEGTAMDPDGTPHASGGTGGQSGDQAGTARDPDGSPSSPEGTPMDPNGGPTRQVGTAMDPND